MALAVAVPVAYLLVVIGDEPAAAWDALWRERTLALLARSVALAVCVGAGAVALAVPLAWLTTRCDLPGRRLWSVLTALPLVIPSYIARLPVRLGARPARRAAAGTGAAGRRHACPACTASAAPGSC